MTSHVVHLRTEGCTVGAYGATNQGSMTFLHFLLGIGLERDDNNSQEQQKWWLDFVLDDHPEKADTYCPGTSIPVLSTSSLATKEGSASVDEKGVGDDMDTDDNPLVLIILEWDDWDALAPRLMKRFSGVRDRFVALIPFPVPRVIQVSVPTKQMQILDELELSNHDVDDKRMWTRSQH